MIFNNKYRSKVYITHKSGLLLILLWLCTTNVHAQEKTLLYKEYIEQVVTQHPIAKIAENQLARAEADALAARGMFDPEIQSDFSHKHFKEKDYYRILSTKINFPSWYGLSFAAGYENTEGENLNPQLKTPEYGLWYAGVELNVLQGFLFDNRRAQLKIARNSQLISENKKTALLNGLVYSASLAYLKWQMAYQTQSVVMESIELAQQYFEGTRQSFLNGEKPAIDTLEAYLIIQDRIAIQQANEMELVAANQKINDFLWNSEQPENKDEQSPQTEIDLFPNFTQPRGEKIDSIVNLHPEVKEKRLKQSNYQIERRLKVEKLKPKLKLKFTPLVNTQKKDIAPDYSPNNYKWGVSAAMPILLRRERAEVKKSNIKIKEIGFEIQNKQNQLTNKLKATLKKQELIEKQIELQNNNLNHYKSLLDAEREKLFVGESSVFLLNKRQEKYLQAQLKLIALKTKYQIELLNSKLLSNSLL